MRKIKLFALSVALIGAMGLRAQCNLVAVPDPTSLYEPTQIENGGFETEPTMAGSGANRIPNGTNQGWNTTENGGQCFEWLGGMGWHSPGLSIIGTHCIEMNADNSATVYQDLYTNGGDVIRWSLGHAVRMSCGEEQQDMRVEVGAPLYDNGNIVYPSGINADINTNIDPDTKATYRSDGITNPTGHEYGFNGQNLENLKVTTSAALQWYFASGVYVVPESQPVTRFAFVSEDTSNPGCGNLLDEISFSTLIGDLSATYGDNNSVVIKGYWGETDTSKKLIIDINGTTYNVDMTSVSGQNFVITMTEACYDNTPSDIKIYHEDYESAARTISVNYPFSASAADVVLEYDGNAHTISPAVTVPESGYTLKYGISYRGINLTTCPEYTTIGTYPIYYSVSAPGYTTYKGNATLRIKPVPHDITLTVNDPAMGSLRVGLVVYSEDFETLDNGAFELPNGWTNDNERPWVVENHTLKSGNAGQDNSNSTIQATYNFTNPGKISFSYRISSEGYSDKGFFSIDGVTKINVSGSSDGTFTENVDAGEHTFSWWYSKDGSQSHGEDAFFIDNIVIQEVHPVNDTTITCLTADDLELVATPEEGSYFVRWDDNSTDENRVVTIDQDMTITAYFNAYAHVTVNSNAPSKGTATIPGDQGNEAFTTINSTNFNGTHFNIVGQDADGDGIDLGHGRSITISSLNGEKITSLTFTVGYGSGIPVPSSGTVSGNSITDINATSVTINSDASGWYQWNQITVNYNNIPAGVLEVGDGTFYVVPGSEVPFTATPNTGESFYGWLDADNKTLSTESTFNMAINEDMTLTAYFDPAPTVVEIGDPNSASEIETFLTTYNGQTIDELIIDRPVLNNMYNTLCLPFDMNAAQIAASSLNGIEIYELEDVSVENDELYLYTGAQKNAIVAGRPYLVKFSDASQLDQLTFANVVVNNANLTEEAVTIKGVTFTGTFQPVVLGAQTELNFNGGHLFLGQNNQLFWPNTNNPLKPFRAYFTVNVDAGQAAGMPMRRGMPAHIGQPAQMPTGVESIQPSAVSSQKVMIDGVLYIIRGEHMYDAQGQMVK